MLAKYYIQMVKAGIDGKYPDIESVIRKIESQNIFWYCPTTPSLHHPIIFEDGIIEFAVGVIRTSKLNLMDNVNANEQLWTTCLIKDTEGIFIRMATKHNFNYYDDVKSNKPTEKKFELMNLYTTDFSSIEIIPDEIGDKHDFKN